MATVARGRTSSGAFAGRPPPKEGGRHFQFCLLFFGPDNGRHLGNRVRACCLLCYLSRGPLISGVDPRLNPPWLCLSLVEQIWSLPGFRISTRGGGGESKPRCAPWTKDAAGSLLGRALRPHRQQRDPARSEWSCASKQRATTPGRADTFVSAEISTSTVSPLRSIETPPSRARMRVGGPFLISTFWVNFDLDTFSEPLSKCLKPRYHSEPLRERRVPATPACLALP